MKKVIRLVAALLVASSFVMAAGAAAFTPSVEQKGAPTVVEGDLYVVPMSEKDDSAADIKAALEAAYDSIVTAGSVAEAAPAVVDTLKEVAPDADPADLVVRDLFYVGSTTPLAEGEERVVVFEVEGVQKDTVLIVMTYVDGEWVVTDPAKVEIIEDGKVQVAISTFGPVAFVTVNNED